VERHSFHFVDYTRKNGRSKSSEEISRSSRIVRSCRGARRLRREDSKSLKLRRGRAIDSESQEPSDLHVVSCIGDS
jgi:hypothetical protein